MDPASRLSLLASIRNTYLKFGGKVEDLTDGGLSQLHVPPDHSGRFLYVAMCHLHFASYPVPTKTVGVMPEEIRHVLNEITDSKMKDKLTSAFENAMVESNCALPKDSVEAIVKSEVKKMANLFRPLRLTAEYQVKYMLEHTKDVVTWKDRCMFFATLHILLYHLYETFRGDMITDLERRVMDDLEEDQDHSGLIKGLESAVGYDMEFRSPDEESSN